MNATALIAPARTVDTGGHPAARVEQGRGWTMYLGDCHVVLPQLDRVDVIITDPPYSATVHSKSRRGATLPDVNEFGCRHHRAREFGFDAIRPWEVAISSAYFMRLARRWVLVFSDVELSPVWRAKLTRAGAEHIRTGAWWKVGGTPQFTGDRPAPGFEAINIVHPRGRKRWNGGGHAASWAWPPEELPHIFKHPIEANRAGNRHVRRHTAQKPLPLMLELVDVFSDPGETVLDAYAGFATTGVACLRRGRQFIGIERDETSFTDAVARLRAEEMQSTHHAARSGQVALFGGGR
ncbi:site-specific DNA-methyltransferase [Pendulispora brunnea]|uniref:Methyltransferase n=1 Tax=Pendulispora brunnea TaxID=2905690 RepID=A0ABZ2KDF0_9BACT